MAGVVNYYESVYLILLIGCEDFSIPLKVSFNLVFVDLINFDNIIFLKTIFENSLCKDIDIIFGCKKILKASIELVANDSIVVVTDDKA